MREELPSSAWVFSSADAPVPGRPTLGSPALIKRGRLTIPSRRVGCKHEIELRGPGWQRWQRQGPTTPLRHYRPVVPVARSGEPRSAVRDVPTMKEAAGYH